MGRGGPDIFDAGVRKAPSLALAGVVAMIGCAASSAAACQLPAGAIDAPPPTGAPPTTGQEVPRPPSAQSRGKVELVVPVLVNDRLVGDVAVKADATGAGDLDAARLMAVLDDMPDSELRSALVARIAGRPRVPFDELTIGPMTIVYDPATLEIRISLPASRMQELPLSFRGAEPPEPGRFMPQADYAGGVAVGVRQRFVESGPNRGRAPLVVNADAFLTVGAFPGVTLQGGGIFTEARGHGFTFERALTRASYDDFEHAVHYVAGEFNPAVSGFQGSARMLGLGIARDYAGIRPFENIRPSGRGSITLERPSTVIVEVNGLETRRLQLEPGRFLLTDLSSASGANDVRLFVQDDLGRREVASAAFFTASAMLAPGLTDFGLAVGKRESARTKYGGPLTATGYIRKGLGGMLTLGASAQFAAGDWQLGSEAVIGTPLGLFRGQANASNVGGRDGYAISVDWLHNFDADGASWSFTVLTSLYSRHFASPLDGPGRDNDQKWRIDARADWRRGPITMTLSGSFARTRSRSEEQRVELTGYLGRGRWSFTGTAGVEKIGVRNWGPRALLGVSLQMGSRTVATMRADTRRGAVVAELSRYPVDEVGDLSGRVQLVRESDRLGLGGEARYFGNRVIASAEQSLYYAQNPRGIGTRETVLRASTFLGIADGSIALGRPPQGGFAIYDRHKSLKGAKLEVRDEAGLIVAKQDWLGAPIVPFNRAFSPVYQTYEVDPLPTGYDLGESRLAAFPGANSGYRVAVGSDASRIAIGYLIGGDGPIVNMSGSVERVGGEGHVQRPFFTNATGRFAVDQLEPGEYRMMIGEREVARFVISKDSEGMVDVGKIAAKTP